MPILHTLEIFQIKYNDFFSCVSKFHLPCVRSFYDGTQVYCLPSAITSYMTFMNIDYKYFSGSRDSIEIVNKYRCRGYGTCINDYEKIHLIEYSKNVKEWQNLLNITDYKSRFSVFGPLKLSHKMFKPRRYNSILYNDDYPVLDIYNEDIKVNYITTYLDLVDEYIELPTTRNENNQIYSDLLISILQYKTINKHGYINPIKTWIMEAVYDNYDH